MIGDRVGLYTLCDESMSVLHLSEGISMYVLLVGSPTLALIMAGLKLIFKGRYHATKEPTWN